MARNRSEKGPLADPEVYEYLRVWCARARIEQGRQFEDYSDEPEWRRLTDRRYDLWAEMPPQKRKIIRGIHNHDRQEAFDAS